MAKRQGKQATAEVVLTGGSLLESLVGVGKLDRSKKVTVNEDDRLVMSDIANEISQGIGYDVNGVTGDLIEFSDHGGQRWELEVDLERKRVRIGPQGDVSGNPWTRFRTADDVVSEVSYMTESKKASTDSGKKSVNEGVSPSLLKRLQRIASRTAYVTTGRVINGEVTVTQRTRSGYEYSHYVSDFGGETIEARSEETGEVYDLDTSELFDFFDAEGHDRFEDLGESVKRVPHEPKVGRVNEGRKSKTPTQMRDGVSLQFWWDEDPWEIRWDAEQKLSFIYHKGLILINVSTEKPQDVWVRNFKNSAKEFVTPSKSYSTPDWDARDRAEDDRLAKLRPAKPYSFHVSLSSAAKVGMTLDDVRVIIQREAAEAGSYITGEKADLKGRGKARAPVAIRFVTGVDDRVDLDFADRVRRALQGAHVSVQLGESFLPREIESALSNFSAGTNESAKPADNRCDVALNEASRDNADLKSIKDSIEGTLSQELRMDLGRTRMSLGVITVEASASSMYKDLTFTVVVDTTVNTVRVTGDTTASAEYSDMRRNYDLVAELQMIFDPILQGFGESVKPATNYRGVPLSESLLK